MLGHNSPFLPALCKMSLLRPSLGVLTGAAAGRNDWDGAPQGMKTEILGNSA